MALQIFSSLHAAAAPSNAYNVEVRNDGAMVYKNPNFDAPVVAYLKIGQRYLISKKKSGAFHKIKLRNGRYGYIADTDITLPGKKSRSKSKARANKNDPKIEKTKSLEDTKMWGFALSNVSFTESTVGKLFTDDMTFYGAKFTGPGILSEGSPMDVNVLISTQAPSYYEKITGESVSSFIMLMDTLFITPFDGTFNRTVYFGFGPLFRYSRINTRVGDLDLDMQDLRLGAAFNLGIALRISSVALRLEAKYYWEREKYMAYLFALQFPF